MSQQAKFAGGPWDGERLTATSQLPSDVRFPVGGDNAEWEHLYTLRGTSATEYFYEQGRSDSEGGPTPRGCAGMTGASEVRWFPNWERTRRHAVAGFHDTGERAKAVCGVTLFLCSAHELKNFNSVPKCRKCNR